MQSQVGRTASGSRVEDSLERGGNTDGSCASELSLSGELVEGYAASIAVHFIVGFPVVPNGQTHNGLLWVVWHCAFSPQRFWWHTFMHILLMQLFSVGHSSFLEHPIVIGGGIGIFGGRSIGVSSGFGVVSAKGGKGAYVSPGIG